MCQEVRTMLMSCKNVDFLTVPIWCLESRLFFCVPSIGPYLLLAGRTHEEKGAILLCVAKIFHYENGNSDPVMYVDEGFVNQGPMRRNAVTEKSTLKLYC